MILHMVKLEILGLKRHFHAALALLQELGSLHIEERKDQLHLPRFLRPVQLDEEKKKERTSLEQFEALLVELLPLLVAKTTEPATGQETLDETLYGQLKALKEEIGALVAEKNRQEETLVLAKKYEAALKAFLPLLKKLKTGQAYTTSLITFDKGALKTLQEKLVRLTKDDFFLEAEKSEEVMCGALAYPRQWEELVKEQLWQDGIDELILPSELRGKDPKLSLEELDRRKETLPKTIQELSQKIAHLRENKAGRCLRISLMTQERLSRYRILSSFSESDYTFYLVAWVPQDQVAHLQKELHRHFGEGVVFRELAQEKWKQEEIPVTLKNPKWLKPFELLVKLLPPPTYGTLDATFFVALFFPFFFGLILGDLGYGLVLLAMTRWGALRAIMRFLGTEDQKTLRQINQIAYTCCGTTLFFGLLFGEFFGTLGHGWLIPIWADRLAVTTQLLAFSILIGVVHVLLGILLGMIVALKERNWRHLLEKFALLLFLAGSIFAANIVLGKRGEVLFLSNFLTPLTSGALAAGLMTVSWIFLGIAAGMAGLIESFSIISNTLSYARLMAIGLASVGLAKVANDLGGLTGGFLGILIAFSLHAVNMALGIFAPTIQSLRLNYVEFFTKFYKSGGREYAPFRKP
ncbi:MAG: V-type ATPase 116kDa subunit family protein [Candidatus Omnitrophota bacterium]